MPALEQRKDRHVDRSGSLAARSGPCRFPRIASSSAGSPLASITRVALVTGSSSGIGAATVRALAAPGLAIAIHARKNRSGRGEGGAAPSREAGAQTLIVEGDLAQAGIATRLVEETVARFGQLDVIVSNAGFADRRPIGEIDRAGLGCLARRHDDGLLRARDRGQAVADQGGRERAADRRVVLRGARLRARPDDLSRVGGGQGRHGGAGQRAGGRYRLVGRRP